MRTVLLVEDDFDNVALMEDIFAFSEIDVKLVIAHTGEEALRLTEEHQPVLILMDIQLPGMGGLEATRRLKQDPQTQHIPIWAVTAAAMKGDAERALAAGCCTYVTKPLQTREFVDMLRHALTPTAS